MFAPLGLFFHVVFLYVCPSLFVTMFLFICVCSSVFCFVFFFCGYFLCTCCSLLFPLLLLFYAGLILCKFGGDDLQEYKRETQRERGGGGAVCNLYQETVLSYYENWTIAVNRTEL